MHHWGCSARAHSKFASWSRLLPQFVLSLSSCDSTDAVLGEELLCFFAPQREFGISPHFFQWLVSVVMSEKVSLD